MSACGVHQLVKGPACAKQLAKSLANLLASLGCHVCQLQRTDLRLGRAWQCAQEPAPLGGVAASTHQRPHGPRQLRVEETCSSCGWPVRRTASAAAQVQGQGATSGTPGSAQRVAQGSSEMSSIWCLSVQL